MPIKNIPTGWRRMTLGELIFPVSETFDFSHIVEVHFLNTGDILDGKLLHNNLTKVASLPGQAKKSFRKGDILYSEIRPENKRFMFVNFDAYQSVASTKLMVLRTKEGVDVRFIYKLLTSDNIIQEFQLIAESRSGTFPQITFDAISKLSVLLPPIKEQQLIADFIYSLDNKIELLRENNATIETTVQTVFQDWFGKYILAESSSNGYYITTLGEFIEHCKIPIVPQNKRDDYFYHYSLPAFDDGKNPPKEKGEIILSNKYKVVPNSFLVSKLNPSTPRVWTIINPEENSVCSTEFQVIRPVKEEYFSFVYAILNSRYFTDKFASGAQGTSGSHQRAKPEDIGNVEVVVPHLNLIIDFHQLILPMINKIDLNYLQIQSLSKTRDELLPRLMNEEVRITSTL